MGPGRCGAPQRRECVYARVCAASEKGRGGGGGEGGGWVLASLGRIGPSFAGRGRARAHVPARARTHNCTATPSGPRPGAGGRGGEGHTHARRGARCVRPAGRGRRARASAPPVQRVCVPVPRCGGATAKEKRGAKKWGRCEKRKTHSLHPPFRPLPDAPSRVCGGWLIHMLPGASARRGGPSPAAAAAADAVLAAGTADDAAAAVRACWGEVEAG